VDVKGFQKCCISSVLDETDEDKLWNDGKEDGNVRSKEDEGTDREDGDSDADW
jgi:hypothetical protein